MESFDLNASQKTKSTPAGEIPVDWGCVRLHEVAIIQTGLSKSEQRPGETVKMPYLRVANVQDGHFNLSEIKQIAVPVAAVDRFRVCAGDVLLTEGGDFDKLGRGAVWAGQIPDCVHQNHLFVVRPKQGVLDARFFAYQTQMRQGRIYFQSCSKQSTNLASINSTQLKQFPVALPPFAEQIEIVTALSSWSEMLEKTDDLIQAKSQQKKAFMQQFLTSVSARAGTTHARHRIGEVCERVTRKNVELDDNVLTISGQDGLVSQKEYFARGIASADSSGYYLLQQGEFAYNRSTSKGYPLGAIKRLDRYKKGVVSTLYLCFRIKSTDTTSSNYLCHYFESGRLNSALRSIAKEGARAHGLLNVSTEEFFDLDIFFPPLSEQQKIANILDTCDEELRLLRSERAFLAQQKRGLMQRLLTGKIRVKPDHPSN